jgi:hypothetical protein
MISIIELLLACLDQLPLVLKKYFIPFCKTSYLNEVVIRTGAVPSARVPCYYPFKAS